MKLLAKPVLVSAVNGKAGTIIKWNVVKGAQKYYIYRKESGVKWNKVSGAETYYVYRKTQSGSYSCIGKTNGVSYTDKTAKSNIVYYYTVRAKAGSSLSSFNSGTVSR